ncbi:MAG TPA: hypothetical protein VMV69_07770 [Pirellulales bacterium]|nr:hypothetical protein [Pirellulales bacterium]
MTTNQHPQDAATRRIRKLLVDRYGKRHRRARVDVYRYNPCAIRIRIVDPDFAGKPIYDRWDEIWAILDDLPEETYSDITVCLLITPEEQPKSMMNIEFEDPLPAEA